MIKPYHINTLKNFNFFRVYTFTVVTFTYLLLGKNPTMHAFSLDNDPNCDICNMVLD